ncbi:MAG TPA: alpha/beta fold hydrolase [Polyangia bacterium]|nr:alpha/beta fold hydrolase [Polyangia bacterium]
MKRPSFLRVLRPADEPALPAPPAPSAPTDPEPEGPDRPLFKRLLPDPEPLRQDLVGGGHALAYFRHLMRGNRIRRRAFLEHIDADHPPVLLLHGFLGTRGSMFMLEHRLGRDGICVFSFNLGSFNTRDIRASAFLIHKKIESILTQTPVKKIDIIGHSMGGLIGLYYLKKLGGHEKVRKLIMMGTPQKGTWSALAGVATVGLWSASSWQILPGSRFLRDLHHGDLPKGIEYYTIAAVRDWVCPLLSTDLVGATALTVPLGHSSLVVSPEVYKRILWALRR